MRSTFASVCYCAALVATVADAATAHTGVVKVDAKHKHVLRPRARKISKRDNSTSSSLTFNDHWVPAGGYFVETTVGTPPQKFELLLDTGSSNYWVPESTAATCEEYLCPGGTYKPKDSSTYSFVQTPAPFNISYADGSTVNGSFASDTVTVAGVTLKNYVFAVAEELQVSPNQKNGPQYGIMGVSYDAGEATVLCGSALNFTCKVANFTKPTIPDALYNGGYIGSRSYSLYLDDLASGSASILFGGVDTAKFTGDLVPLGVPIDPQDGLRDYNYVYLTSVSAKANGSSSQFTPSNYKDIVILDSGNTGVDLPPSVYNELAKSLGFPAEGGAEFPCKDSDQLNFTMTFGLSGTNGKTATIDVPFINFITPLYSGNYNSTTPLKSSSGDDLCLASIYPSSQAALGDPFLRSAYAYFNLGAATISVAQASYDASSSNIKPVGSGPAPSFTGTGKITPAAGPGNSSSSSSSSHSGASLNVGSAFFSVAFATVAVIAALF